MSLNLATMLRASAAGRVGAIRAGGLPAAAFLRAVTDADPLARAAGSSPACCPHASCSAVVVRPPAQAEPAPAVHLSPTTEPGGLS